MGITVNVDDDDVTLDDADSSWVGLNSLPNVDYNESSFMAAIHKEKEKEIALIQRDNAAFINVKNEPMEIEKVTELYLYILLILIYIYIYIICLFIYVSKNK